jgi:hypothetical protein
VRRIGASRRTARQGTVVARVDRARLRAALDRLASLGEPAAVRVDAWAGSLALTTTGRIGQWWEVEDVPAMVPLRLPVPTVSLPWPDLDGAVVVDGSRHLEIRVFPYAAVVDGRELSAVSPGPAAAPVPGAAPVQVLLGSAHDGTPAVLFPTGNTRTLDTDVAGRLSRTVRGGLEAFAAPDGRWFVRSHARSGTTADGTRCVALLQHA